MLDFIWVFPNLNEDLDVVKANLLKCFKYNVSRNFKSEIILSDGGSIYNSVIELNKFVNKLQNNKISSRVILNLPVMRPNKNLGILNIVEKYKSKYVVILDSDFLSLNKRCFDNIVNPLLNDEAKITFPNVTRISGRSNKLIINPLLRLFYSNISNKVNFVLSGILGIDYNVLKKIVTSSDYCWDWGGEIQIICKGFEVGTKAIKVFLHHRTDSKRRSLSSKMKDARQIFRTLLYEINDGNRLSPSKVKEYLISDWKNHKNEVVKFMKWQKLHNINIIDDLGEISEQFDVLLSRCKSNKLWFFLYLDELYKRNSALELAVLKSITVDTALKTLFKINLKYDPVEVDPGKIMKTNMDGVTILADIIFAVYISLWLDDESSKKKNLQNYLDMLSPADTDFTSIQILTKFRKLGLGLIEVNNTKSKLLRHIIKIYNDNSISMQEKNWLLVKRL